MDACGAVQLNGAFTIKVTRIGAVGNEIPVQIFGAISGAHELVQRDFNELSAYLPFLKLNGTSSDTITRFTPQGDFEIIDTNTGEGVKISTNRSDYQSFLEQIKHYQSPYSTALVFDEMKFEFNDDATRGLVINRRSTEIYDDNRNGSIELNEFFSSDQEQNKIIEIKSQIEEIRPVDKWNFLLPANETEIRITLAMNVVNV